MQCQPELTDPRKFRIVTEHPDMVLTQRLKEALALMEVCTLDPIIVGGEATVSFAELSLL